MVRVGIIGAGSNATAHGKYFRNQSRAKVVAVADPVFERAGALAELCGARPVCDYADFLPDVDAVVISSPNFLHCQQAVACAQAGKHIYCEKPMGLSATEASRIADAVQVANVRSVVGFSVRFGPSVQGFLGLHEQGAFGDILSIWSRRMFYMDPAKTVGWRKDHGQSGGLLLEVNLHELDWMMALGGPVESVSARTRAIEPTSPRSNDHLWVTLHFAKGAIGTHEGSWLTAMPSYFKGIHGTLGGACTDEWGNKLFYAKVGQNREEMPATPAFDLRGHFLDCIELGVSPVADVRWGLKVMLVAEAIFRSAQSGQVEKVEVAAPERRAQISVVLPKENACGLPITR